MKYYTIQENNLLIAENEKALSRYYENVLILPEDYEQDKYIIKEEELVLNPQWENVMKQKETSLKRENLKSQLDELDKKRIRAICENEIKDEQTNQTWLDFYNQKVKELRKELKSL